MTPCIYAGCTLGLEWHPFMVMRCDMYCVGHDVIFRHTGTQHFNSKEDVPALDFIITSEDDSAWFDIGSTIVVPAARVRVMNADAATHLYHNVSDDDRRFARLEHMMTP